MVVRCPRPTANSKRTYDGWECGWGATTSHSHVNEGRLRASFFYNRTRTAKRFLVRGYTRRIKKRSGLVSRLLSRSDWRTLTRLNMCRVSNDICAMSDRRQYFAVRIGGERRRFVTIMRTPSPAAQG